MYKILFFMHGFSGGGAEKVTVCLANELQKKGYNVTFVVMYDEGENKDLLDSSIPIINLDLQMKSKILKNIKNIMKLRKVFKEEHDICFSVSTNMSLIAAISNFTIKKRITLIPVIHNTISSEQRSFSKIRNYLIKLFDKYTTQTVVVSKEAARDYIETCKVRSEKVITIYNPVISQKLYNLSKENPNHKWLKDERNYKVIITAGRLSYQKNHELLIRSLKEIREKNDVRLIILGIGELEEDLKKICDNLDISEYVDFVGYTQNPYSYFSKADVFVLSSRYEGLPTVLIEALGCGCKVVSTGCPSGPKEILDNGKYGILVEQDEESLIAGVNQALNQMDCKEELIKYSENFSVQKSVEKYIELIESI